MALLDSTVGLIFALKADPSDAEKGISDLRKHIDDETDKIKESGDNAFLSLGKSIGLTDEQMVGLGKAIPITGAVAAGIAGIATAAVGTAAAIFKLAQEASDFGGEIFDASEKTGLSAETLSALKYEADKSGIAFETVSSSISKFSKLVAEASRGSEEAKNKLKELGIDPVKAASDLEGALTKVFARIVSLPPGIAQMTAAQDAFGKSGADLLPFLKDFDGDMKGLIETAKHLGVTISDDAAAQADEFGDTLKDLEAQGSAVYRQLGFQLLPTLIDLAKSFSKFISDNKTEIASWGTWVANTVKGVIQAFKEVVQFINDHPTLFRIAGAVATAGASEAFIGSVKTFNSFGENQPTPQTSSEQPVYDATKQDGADYLDDLKAKAKQAEEARKQAEQDAKRSVSANLQLWQNYGKEIQNLFSETFKDLSKTYKETGNLEAFKSDVKNLTDWYSKEIDPIIDKITGFENKQADAEKKNAAERELLLQQQTTRRKEWNKIAEDAVKQSEETQTETIKQESEKRVKVSEEEANRKIQTEKSSAQTRLAELQSDLQKDLALKKSYRDQERNDFDLITTTETTELEKVLGKRLLNETRYALAVNKIKLDTLEKEKELIKSIIQTDENRAAIQQRLKLLDEEIARQKIENESFIGEMDKARAERELKEVDLLLEKLEIQQKINEAKENEPLPPASSRPGYDANGNETTDIDRGPFAGWTDSWNEFKTALEQDSVGIGNIVTQMAKLFQDAFYGMANALGNAVENWVLYGESIGKALKKALAAELAHIAGVATVKALYATALGFLRLAEWDFVGAGHAFLSAGLWAALAGGTALAARALAGNQNAQTSFSGATRANTATKAVSSGSTNGGRAYSSSGDQVTTITNDRNHPQERRITISLERGLIAEVIKEDINSNGSIRRTLIDVVQGA